MSTASLAYTGFKGVIWTSQAIYTPVSTYYNNLGFAVTATGFTRAANQVAEFLKKREIFPAAEGFLRALGAPEELLTTSKNTLTWFELATRISRVPHMGEGSWQKGIALIAQIFQKALGSIIILPMKWGFRAKSPNLEHYKFAQEIFSGVANIFGIFALRNEIDLLRKKIKKLENHPSVSVYDLTKLQDKLRKVADEIEKGKTLNPQEFLEEREKELFQEFLAKANSAPSRTQRVFLKTIAGFRWLKMRALLQHYATSLSNADEAKKVLAQLENKEKKLREKWAIRTVVSSSDNRPVAKVMRSNEDNRIATKTHNLKVQLGGMERARDLNIAKCFLIPLSGLEYFKKQNVWIEAFGFGVGLLLIFTGFRRTFYPFNHRTRIAEPLRTAEFFLS